MKKLSLLLFAIVMLTVSCSAQTYKWYTINYKANFIDSVKFSKPIKINGVLITSTPAELNTLHGISTTGVELGYVHGLTSAIQTQLNAKQATLVSGTTLKTVGGITLLGSGDIPTSGTGTVTSVSVTTGNGVSASVTNPTSAPALLFTLGAITPTTVNGVALVSGGSTPTLTITGTSAISGTNTGDNAINSLYSGLITNATHTGDATGATALTVVKINGTLLSGLSTGLLKNTTGTGVPSIATAGVDYLAPSGSAAALTNFPTLNQSTTGNAATATKLATARNINGIAFDGSASITIPSDITPSTSGNLMQSNGSVWTSVTPSTIDYNSVLNTQISAALTDGAPTAAEINAATALTPATAGAGYHRTIKDSNGTGLLYHIESDGTSWYYWVGVKAN